MERSLNGYALLIFALVCCVVSAGFCFYNGFAGGGFLLLAVSGGLAFLLWGQMYSIFLQGTTQTLNRQSDLMDVQCIFMQAQGVIRIGHMLKKLDETPTEMSEALRAEFTALRERHHALELKVLEGDGLDSAISRVLTEDILAFFRRFSSAPYVHLKTRSGNPKISLH